MLGFLAGRGARLPAIVLPPTWGVLARVFSVSTQPGAGEESGARQPPLRPVQTFLQQQVSAGAMQPDESQLAAAQLLDGVFSSMVHQMGRAAASAASAPPPNQAALQQTAQQAAPQQQQQHEQPQEEVLPIQGAYIWGEVGSGKTLLMDSFQRAAAAALPPLPLPPQQQRQGQQAARPAAPAATLEAASAGVQEKSPTAAAAEAGSLPAAAKAAARGREAVRRTHFHAFMLDVHKRLHELHQRVPRVAGKSRQGLPVFRYAPILEDPVKLVGHQLAQEAKLLCLDELHVTDVADALILNKLFSAILERGSWVMFTSNRPPQDLYRGGLSRKYFEPFIHLVSRRLQVLRVGSGVDYRQHSLGSKSSGQQQEQQGAGRPSSRGLHLVGPPSEAGQQLRQDWERWLQEHGVQPAPMRLPVGFGRELHLPQAAFVPHHGVAAYLTFDQLCGRHGIEGHARQLGAALGPADLVALASHLSVLFVESVPQLAPAQRDEARRFLTAVDALYDFEVQLRCSMAAPPLELFLPLLAAAQAQGVDPNLGVAAGTALQVPAVQAPGPEDRDPEDQTTRATLEEEVLMYRRAMSRLQQMTNSST